MTPACAPLTVVLNPAARRGHHAHSALSVLRAAGFAPRVLTVGRDDVQASLTCAVEGGAPLVVIGGGDGTLSRTVAPLLHSDTALGILPLGNGNTFARNLGLPTDPALAARLIVQGQARRVDVGFLNDRPFLNSASLGLSARVATLLTRPLKRRLGWLAYAAVAWRLLAQRAAFPARLELDGRPATAYGAQLVFANALNVADALLVPGADFEDGELVALSLPGATRTALLLRALRWRLGDQSAVRAARFHEARLWLPEGQRPVNLDGEVCWPESWPLVLRGAKRALKVMSPA